AERVRLDVRQIQELLDAGVAAAQQLRVHVGVDDVLADRLESATEEESGLEGEAEESGESELAGPLLQSFDERAADAVVQMILADEQRAHLAEVLPHDVQGSASDQLSAVFGDDELLHRPVQHGEILAEQDASLHQRLQKSVDAGDVG